MADRYTRKHAETAFAHLIDAIGGRIATDYNDVGAYRLDYIRYEGGNSGYVIERITSDGGAIIHPLGAQRRNAREFYDACWYTMRVLEEAHRLQTGESYSYTPYTIRGRKDRRGQPLLETSQSPLEPESPAPAYMLEDREC